MPGAGASAAFPARRWQCEARHVEVLYMPEIPNAVAINEAVELAKKYDDADTVKFVNGVLGSFAREENP